MFATIGVLLVLAAYLMFQFAYIHHRRPVPSRWTRPEFVSQLYVCPMLSVFAGGAGCLVAFFNKPGAGAFDAIHATAIAAGLGVAVLASAAMFRQWRKFKLEAPAQEPPVPRRAARPERTAA